MALVIFNRRLRLAADALRGREFLLPLRKTGEHKQRGTGRKYRRRTQFHWLTFTGRELCERRPGSMHSCAFDLPPCSDGARGQKLIEVSSIRRGSKLVIYTERRKKEADGSPRGQNRSRDGGNINAGRMRHCDETKRCAFSL